MGAVHCYTPWVWEGYTVIHPGYGRHAWYIYTLGMGGMPGIYTPWVCRRYTHPGYTHHYTTLGTPSYHPAVLVTSVLLHVSQWRSPGLKRGESPGWGGLEPLRTSRVWWEKGDLCAVLLRFSRVINVDDRIDEGSFPVYTLGRSTVAQRGVLLRPSDRCWCSAPWGASYRPSLLKNVRNVAQTGAIP